MGVGDGTVQGKTKIVNNGSPADRWNLVLVSEGYRDVEMSDFANDAQQFVDTLFATVPFTNPTPTVFAEPKDAINVYRVNVTSTDSGADDPVTCTGGTGATAATYFDASFCNGGVRRLLVVDNASVINVVDGQVPEWHAIMVLVNSSIYGGSGGDVATFSMAPSADQIGIHELGHTAFGLADEYEYWAGCGVDTTQNQHPNSEPSQPNVTIDSNRNTIKWGDLIAATTPMPTTQNADCSQCDPQPSPVPVGTVGAFEGAHYYHCGAYRPQFRCLMRALNQPFCAVCQRVIRQTLRPFMPRQRILDVLDELTLLKRIINPIDLVADPIPIDLARLRGLIREARPSAREIGSDRLSLLLERLEIMEVGQLRTTLVSVKAEIARLEAAARVIEAELGKKKV